MSDRCERDDGLTEQAARVYADEVTRLRDDLARVTRERDEAVERARRCGIDLETWLVKRNEAVARAEKAERERDDARTAAIRTTTDEQGRRHRDLWSVVAEKAERERDALAATHADVMTVVQRYQPGGSPPAGDVLLAQWTLETLARERDAARALAASNAETMRACSREATELDRQLGASRAREAALREALREALPVLEEAIDLCATIDGEERATARWQRAKDLLAKEST